MATRFRIYETPIGKKALEGSDRWTIVDARPSNGWRSYFGMNASPFWPQGIGMHGEFSPDVWSALVRARFRNLGKRITGAQLPSDDCRRVLLMFLRESNASKAQIRRAMGVSCG